MPALRTITQTALLLVLSSATFLTVPVLIPCAFFLWLSLNYWLPHHDPGTVRGGNYANVEALVTYWGLLVVAAGVISGVLLILQAVRKRKCNCVLLGRKIELDRGKCITIGVGFMLGAFTCPKILEFLIATARDNLWF